MHPGYGFLSERGRTLPAPATKAGLRFIGPTPAQLALFGDKAQARALAQRRRAADARHAGSGVTLEEAQAFCAARPCRHRDQGHRGGGGRGMRAVASADDLPAAYARCRSEAQAAFGVDGVYVERLMGNARHIEVQVLGDGREVIALGEREMHAAAALSEGGGDRAQPLAARRLRERITTAALSMARAVDYQGLGTFEFLVDLASRPTRLCVHRMQPAPAGGAHHHRRGHRRGPGAGADCAGGGPQAAGLGLDPPAAPCWALRSSGASTPKRWTRRATPPRQRHAAPFDLPSGPGVRVDTHGAAGATPSPHYDTLLAKLIVHTRSSRFADALRRSQRALAECRIDGVATNLALLQALAARPEMESQQVHTRWLEEVLPELAAAKI